MTTCLVIMKAAYRRSGILGAGVELNATQRDVGMDRLQGLYTSMLDSGLFGKLTEYFAEDDYEAQEGERVIANGNTITIPDTVIDDDTGLERTPRDGSVIVVVENDVDPFEAEVNIYSAHHGWIVANNLVYSDDAPLTGSFEEEIKNLLAGELAGENGIPITPSLARNMTVARVNIGSRYSIERKAVRHTFF